MSQESRPRTASFSEDHNWPRQKPVFSLLALLLRSFREREFSPGSSRRSGHLCSNTTSRITSEPLTSVGKAADYCIRQVRIVYS